MILKFTEQANSNKPIKIFGGDLDFLGNVHKRAEQSAEKVEDIRFSFTNPDKQSIEENAQFVQLQSNFKKIHILCLKPSKNDTQYKLRLGFLVNTFKEKLQIKFFEEQNCSNCPDELQCKTCDVCKECSNAAICKHSRNECTKYKKFARGSCYNPDLNIRGRIRYPC